MYSQNILMSISYPRSVDSRNGFTPERSSLIHASASAGVHCHGGSVAKIGGSQR